jgi:hypothetical protein
MKLFTVSDMYTGRTQTVELVRETKCYYIVIVKLGSSDKSIQERFHKSTMASGSWWLNFKEVEKETAPPVVMSHGTTLEDMKDLKVFTYFNLHKMVFSVKALEGPNKGRVIAHTESIQLTDVTFKVSQAGRTRVLNEQKKNVHAGVIGTFKSFDKASTECLKMAYYNPYKTNQFLNGDEVLLTAGYALLDSKKVFFK